MSSHSLSALFFKNIKLLIYGFSTDCILSKFVMLNGWIEKKVYVDDGYGGGTFQRPAFMEMLEDIKSGEINLNRLKKQLLIDDEKEHGDIRQEVQRLEKRLHDIDRVTAELYEDKVTGKISADTFSTLMQKSEAERKEKAARFDTLSAQLKTRNSKEIDITTWIKTIRKYLNLETLHRAAIDELIDHIEIGEKQVIDGKCTQDIKIFYNFVGFIG